MKTPNGYRTAEILVAAAVAAILAGCATTPQTPAGSQDVRNKLVALRSNTALAAQVPVAIEQTEAAVKLAETPQSDSELAAHRVYMADHMVDTTRATAETRLAESQRAAISQQSDTNRLAARTFEANAARNAAASARNDAASARNDAAAARNETDAAQLVAANARNETDAAQLAAANARNETDAAQLAVTTARNDALAARAATDATAATAEANRQVLAEQIALLQARTTDRGIVLTLGDVLFATGSANLKPGDVGNLDRLIAFLYKYPNRTAMIEGHTDSMGTDAYNEDLSLRRAESVRGYITGKGVASSRLTSVGRGEAQPLASNDSAAGRQQNRRVEIVIANDLQAAAVTP